MWIALSLATDLILTILIELFIAYKFKVVKSDYIFIVLVNTITNLTLGLIMLYVNQIFDDNLVYLLFLIIFEVIIIFVEYFIYKKILEHKNTFYLSLVSNSITGAIGLVSSIIIFLCI